LTGHANTHLKQLITALEAAVEAGNYFRSRIHTELEVKTKSSPSDLVTDVDPACEHMIRRRIADNFPHHQILGEETTAPGAVASSHAAAEVVGKEAYWIVDPLDGTTNFVHGLPLSVVSIAYAEGDSVRVGVIYDPYRDEVFYGLRGSGAYLATSKELLQWMEAEGIGAADEPLPGEQLHVSPLEELGKSVVATGIPTRSATYDDTTQATIYLLGHIKSIRALGAAALHLAYVASGRIDVFWEYDLNAWDLAAGVMLVNEAGGYVRELGGGSYHLEVRNILVSGTEGLGRTVDSILTQSDANVGAIKQ
jgi:myo-inositol-1(or 4)-monophosphatase